MPRALAPLIVLAVAAAFAAAAAEPVPAHRIALRYQQGTFFVVSAQEVLTAIPPAEALPASTLPLGGFWLEVQDASGALRHRSLIGDPLRLWHEDVDSGVAGSFLVRREMIPQSRLFTVLVPRLVDGDRLVLFSSPLIPGFHDQAAAEVARLSVDLE